MTALTMWLLLGAFVAVNCDLSGSEQNSLYNIQVKYVEWVTRPDQDIPSWVPRWCVTTHSGISLTLQDGRNFVIHKGPDYDVTSEKQVKETSYVFSRTVGDFIKAAKENYSIWSGQHCQIADMRNLE